MRWSLWLWCSLLLLPVLAQGKDYYVTPTGAGLANGTNYANAYAKAKIQGVLNTTMVAGDTLHLGSGTYTSVSMEITTSGTQALPKRILGEDTGAGRPVFRGTWVRTATEDGTGVLLAFGKNGLGVGHWVVENIAFTKAEHAIDARSVTTGADHTNLVFRNLDIYEIRHAFYMLNMDDSRIEHCKARGYSKMGYRLDRACDRVQFHHCLADLTDGDNTWWDFAEPIPEGFIINDLGLPNTDIAFYDCVAKNHLRNGQVADAYWNGDGFATEGNSVGLIFERCVAINNEDGGFDLKQATTSTLTMKDCVAIGNARNFRYWYGTCNLSNCVATFPRKRGPNTSNGVGAIWVWDATVKADRFTGHGTNATAVKEDRNGSASLTNSILSSTGGTGTFVGGNVVLGTGTVTYRPGAGVDPKYVDAVPAWDGRGANFNNRLYGATKGYYQPPFQPGVSIRRSGQNMLIAFPALTGKTYRVEWRAQLVGGAWMTLLDNIAATGSMYEVVDSSGLAAGSRFYRVVATP